MDPFAVTTLVNWNHPRHDTHLKFPVQNPDGPILSGVANFFCTLAMHNLFCSRLQRFSNDAFAIIEARRNIEFMINK